MADARGFEDGAAVIARNPFPEFDKILARGYAMYYHLRRIPDEGILDLSVEVRLAAHVVGSATFSDRGRYAYCQNVGTVEAYRIQGIATAMYVFARSIFGKPLSNFWDGHGEQSADAKALWAKKGHLFRAS